MRLRLNNDCSIQPGTNLATLGLIDLSGYEPKTLIRGACGNLHIRLCYYVPIISSRKKERKEDKTSQLNGKRIREDVFNPSSLFEIRHAYFSYVVETV